MTWLYALQFAAPLILMGCLTWWPARSGLGFVAQVFGSVAALAVMALQGIWLLPPWWAPVVFAVAMGIAAGLGWRRIRPFASGVDIVALDRLGLRARGVQPHVQSQGPGSIDAPLSSVPRPIQFNGRFPVRGDRIEVP